MKKTTVAGLCLWALSGAVTPVLAQEASSEQCLECHEPAEDWAGMTVVEIIASAKDAGNKRHADNMGLSDEQLTVIIGELMPQ